MNTFALRASFALATLLAFIWAAPASQAMVAPEPTPGTPTATVVSASGGVAIWQVIAIALVAAAIGAAGATLAQRTRREDVRSLTMA
jgi:hypothetical protein